MERLLGSTLPLESFFGLEAREEKYLCALFGKFGPFGGEKLQFCDLEVKLTWNPRPPPLQKQSRTLFGVNTSFRTFFRTGGARGKILMRVI